MAIRVHYICAVVILCVLLPRGADAQGYPGYPNSIMTPERGSGIHQRGSAHRRGSAAETTPATAAATTAATQPHHPSLLGREKFISKLHRRGLYAARGSSGSVLPTPLPRTQIIPISIWARACSEPHAGPTNRNARPCAGHPRLESSDDKDVDGRDRPGHDEEKSRG
jgi:hypothetical protein